MGQMDGMVANVTGASRRLAPCQGRPRPRSRRDLPPNRPGRDRQASPQWYSFAAALDSVRLATLRSATSGWDEMDLASNDGHGEDYQGCADCCACAKAV